MNPNPKTRAKPKRTRWNALEWLAFLAFLAWSAAGYYFISHRITPEIVATWNVPRSVRDFVTFCLTNGDPILILLAFINTHLHTARQWSHNPARQWCVIVLVCSYAIEYTGVKAGVPFGEYSYTGTFGPMLGSVPLTIPLAWHVVLTNSLFIVRTLAPHASQFIEAVLAAVLCTIYDFVLEPFATSVKHYWLWKEGAVPEINYASWFILSALIIRFGAPTFSTVYRWDPRPFLILGLTVAIFIAGELKP